MRRVKPSKFDFQVYLEIFLALKEKEDCAVEGGARKYASDQRALDEVVCEVFGLTKEEQLEISRAVASSSRNASWKPKAYKIGST